ncbi:MAG: TonB-dependent hemoglobin/transferrin/lactoferrin family receptor [Caulobacter sp.]|nr:TonB-dependent hemoglobin/transferrin/lactoferrin family receptor [Caulobacter sp.]
MTLRSTLRRALFAGAAALSLTGGIAHAAEAGSDAGATVDAVIVTATRTQKAADELPVTASAITSDEIDDRLVGDIKDLIKFEPGVAVRTAPARFNAALSGTGRDGNSGFNIRGLEGNRVLIQIDGIRLPDSFGFGAQAVGRGDYADLDMIRSVEIVRGPASALYGSDGLAGSVSFFTKDPEDFLRGGRAFAAQARAGYASADESTYGNLLLAGVFGDWQAMVSYTRRQGSEQETQGRDGSSTATRTVANPQDFTANSVLAKLVFDPAEGHSFRLTWDHLDREVDSDILSAVSATTLSVLTHDETDRDRVSVDYRFTGGEGLVSEARLGVYVQTGETTQFTAEDRTSTDRTRLNTFDNEVRGVSGQIDSRFTTGSVEHHIVWGGDWSVTRQEGIRSGTAPTPPDVFPTRAFPNTDYTLVGLFVQDEIGLFDGKLALFPALRWDWYELDARADALYVGAPRDSSDSHPSPKLGLVWSATENLKVFSNIAAGFKAPAPSQVNNAFSNPAQGYISAPNPDLKPETSETFEVGLRWKSGPLALEGTVFAGRYEDFISQEVVGGSFTPADPAVFQYVNLGEVEISGVEARARLSLDDGWTLIAAASSAKGDARSGGASAPLASIEPVKISLGAGWRDPAGRFGGQLSVVHSAKKDADRVGTTCTPSCFVPPAFTLIDLTGYWNLTGQVTLRGGVFNLTDEKYWWWSDARGLSSTSAARDAYTQPGRNIGLSLTLKL